VTAKRPPGEESAEGRDDDPDWQCHSLVLKYLKVTCFVRLRFVPIPLYNDVSSPSPIARATSQIPPLSAANPARPRRGSFRLCYLAKASAVIASIRLNPLLVWTWNDPEDAALRPSSGSFPQLRTTKHARSRLSQLTRFILFVNVTPGPHRSDATPPRNRLV
jgi:hypothetical protein